VNSGVSSKKIVIISSSFGIVLASVNSLFTTQLIKKKRNSTSPLFSYADLHRILTRKENVIIFSTTGRCFSKY